MFVLGQKIDKSLCFLDQCTLQEWKIVNYHFRDTFHDVVIQKEISFDSGLPALSNSLISMVMDQNIFYYWLNIQHSVGAHSW